MMAPYRLPLWTELGKRLPGGIGVVCLVETEANRNWGRWEQVPFPVAVLPGISFRFGHERHVHLRRGVGRVVRSWQPQVVWIGGWDAPGYWAALRTTRRLGAKALVGVETHARSAGEAVVSRALRRRFLHRVDGVLAHSLAAATYVEGYGVPPERVFEIGNPVDVTEVALAARVYAASEEGRQRRAELQPPVFAFIGQLVERKNVLTFLDAFDRAQTGGSVIVVGDGPLRSEVAARAVRSAAVTYLGSLSPRQTWEVLGIVDCLVLPSVEEVWGLVVNEALAAGAFCVVSDAIGAAELILPERNGVVVSPDLGGITRGLSVAARHVSADGFDRATIAATAEAGDVRRTADAVIAAIGVLGEPV